MTQTLQYQAARLLDDAATLIETTGWCRGSYRVGDRHCTLGALRDVGVGFDSDAYHRAYDALVVELQAADYWEGIANWNDEQRDRRKVVRLLRRAARKVRRTPQ